MDTIKPHLFKTKLEITNDWLYRSCDINLDQNQIVKTKSSDGLFSNVCV